MAEVRAALENNLTFLRGSPSHSYRGQWTTKFQPVMPLHLTEDWMSPNILYDRKADGGDAWTVPIGLAVGKTTKVGRLPMKFQLEFQAMVIHPDDFGERWKIRFSMTPVIPALIKRTLF